MTPDPELQARMRALPSVDQLAAAIHGSARSIPRGSATAAARAVLKQRRSELRTTPRAAGDGELAALVRLGQAWLAPSLRRVLNGTGVIVHTNLGRAPLAEAAANAVAAMAHGYANVELDLTNGQRGSRDTHLTELICELTGAEDALAVNNGAGAALLALAALCGPGAPTNHRPAGAGVAVSRGQLVEIGGGFRIPDVLAQAGARMIEVGTTNRTRLADYQQALAPHAEDGGSGATAILRVHPSNFRTVGFVEDVSIEQLCALGVQVIDDVGSGALARDLAAIVDEPPIARSIAAGAAIVCFSGDKLLGGPQAGILAGRRTAIDACRRHPLARALRIGRLPIAALAATLALYRDPARARSEIPVLAMLDVTPHALQQRAARLAEPFGSSDRVELGHSTARVGGGALPLLELNGPVLRVGGSAEDPAVIARALRHGDPPLMARIAGGRVLVDPRTLADDELSAAATTIAAALEITA